MKWAFLKKVIKSIGSLALATCLSGGRTFAYDVTLAWDPKTDPNLSGYKVYFGTASRTYGVPLDAGKMRHIHSDWPKRRRLLFFRYGLLYIRRRNRLFQRGH